MSFAEQALPLPSAVGHRPLGAGWLLAVALLLPAMSNLATQLGQLQTGLRLRMSDTISGVGAAPQATRAPAAAIAPVAGRGVALRGLTMQLTSGVRIDDNVRRTGRLERSDAAMVFQPSAYLDGEVGRHPFRLGYEGDAARYFKLNDESYFDHALIGRLTWNATRQFRVKLDSALSYGHDERGALDSRVVTFGEPDRWREHKVGIEALLGRRIAKAEIGVGYEVRGIRYRNNNQFARDLDDRLLRLFGRYNVGPRLAVVGEVSGLWTDYLLATSPLDSKEFVGLGGIAWQATAKTSGEVKVGRRHLDFYDSLTRSVSGFTWDATVTWAPRTYSKLTAYTGRDVTQGAFGSGLGSSTARTDSYGLRWKHGVTQRLDFEAGVERSTSDFVNGGSDRFLMMDAGVSYRLNRWVDLLARWDFESRSSARNLADFESHAVFFGADIKLEHVLR